VSADDDLVLLERWRGGEREAGEALFARHFEDVRRFFEHKCAGAADELTQQTFLACVRSRDQFRGHSSFRTYLFTIARHELYRHLRKASRDGDRLDFSVTSIEEVITTPGTKLARQQDVERLRAALRTLPADQQLMLELCYWHELDTAALAEVFELNVATVRTRLFRARRALAEKLAEVADLPASDPLVAGLTKPNDEEPG
jgi:RNA polymerase sigma-70 factor (ECF subfamily)